MVRAAPLVVPAVVTRLLGVAGLTVGLAGCGPGDATRETLPLADAPPPAASERCFRERFVVRGKPFEMQLRVRVEPAARRIVRLVVEHGGNGDATWLTEMNVAGTTFTSLERGPEGEARGEGTLKGADWEWTGWTSVTRRAEGFAEHDDASLTADGLAIASETRAADGQVAATGKRAYLAVSCVTLGDEPIETLYPKLSKP